MPCLTRVMVIALNYFIDSTNIGYILKFSVEN